MGTVDVVLSPYEKMGSDRILGLLLAGVDLSSLRKYSVTKRTLFGLEWSLYGHVVPQNMAYYLRIPTYFHVYVRTLLYMYVHVHIPFYVLIFVYYVYVRVSLYSYIHALYYYIRIYYIWLRIRAHMYLHVYIFMKDWYTVYRELFTYNNYTYIILVGYVYSKIFLSMFVHDLF